MRNLVHTKADKEMQLYILQKDFQFDIKQKMSLILLEQGMYTEQQNDGKFRAMTVKKCLHEHGGFPKQRNHICR